uniref:TAP binding protein like n=1 Tax=Leptobrachium leishanense TaxID=445787 RepID=A0A8C5MW18_9ANUR
MESMKWRSRLLSFLLTLYSSGVQSGVLTGMPRPVDIVLPCSHVLVNEGGSRGMGGMSFPREEATLVLKNLTIIGEEELDSITDFDAPQSSETTTFHAMVSLPPMPFAKRLLHAECEGEEVMCELSHLYTEFYVAHLRLPDLSLSILLRTEPSGDGDPAEVTEEKNILSMTVDLLISSFPPSLVTPTSRNISLNCDVWGILEEVKVDWHLQAGGKGHTIVPEEGTRISLAPVTSEGNQDMSLHINGVRVQDEGTYICTVNTKQHQMQQILKLQIQDPPLVTALLNRSPEPQLICRTDRYYPLDVDVSWMLDGKPVTHITSVTSSHRINIDGTFNLTSYLRVSIPPTGSQPDIYTCSVSHVSIGDPIEVQAIVSTKESESSSGIYGLVAATLLFLAGIKGIFMLKRKWAVKKDKERAKLAKSE